MLYIVSGLVLLATLCVLGLLFFLGANREEEFSDTVEDDEHEEYHKEKQRRIKDQYYRSIDLEEFNRHFGSDPKIVGIAKPQGKWTSMVIKRNMLYITTLKNLMGSNFSKMGIWQLKVKAQSMISHGMHKGRGK
ncbi:hypothetical protein [Neorickettsia sp. 179522]|uniref:hypothetical protein n=1 Tax=Neorickettsia sp. 179522 TaxID=1714371 RepID=UPI00079A88BB|nr:hypothetical protein [Neorickettsia sp. 179522]KYH12710.1 hypothetical protein AS219_02955 [Neorickettsia sp. 179522]